MWKLLFQPLRQRPRGLSLTNGNTVQPDDRLAVDWLELSRGAGAIRQCIYRAPALEKGSEGSERQAER